ncbi:50S ribosomal protein L7/L12 [Quillaja saponaria]|uniref:50S ribosomal protein L7/L12 n=1 Tax=Quillaja saponaria TaxID=32244 RepID=A0AAD7KQM8_QUISA|nr:50S ribosomal protein L7/L12 [Quillaja saponaria]KAJ7944230.1 50S ribosomal protein L7/L12 [Quillaja saponaria]
MRNFRFISSHLSRIQKPLHQNLSFNTSSIQNPNLIPTYKSKIPSFSPSVYPCLRGSYTTQSQESKAVQSEEVSVIVDELMNLTLLEVMDLVEIMREKRGVNELPIMMMMMPGMGIGGLKSGPKGAPKGEEKKAEKTAFNVKLKELRLRQRLR